MFNHEYTMIRKGTDIRIVVEIETDERVESYHNKKFTSYLKVGEVWIINTIVNNVDVLQAKDIIQDLKNEGWNYSDRLKPYEIKYEDHNGEKYFAFL